MRKLVDCPECTAIFGVDLDATPTEAAARVALVEKFAAAALTGWLANPDTRAELFASEDALAVWKIAAEMLAARDEITRLGAGTPVAGADRPFDPKPPPDLSAMKVPE